MDSMPSFISSITERHAIPELGEFVIAKSKQILGDSASGDEMNKLLTAIKLAAKIVNREINKAGLGDILGDAGSTNIQGELQQKLDVFANQKFVEALTKREVVCGICSEEFDEFIPVNEKAQYVLLMDPLDGSSNLDVNVSVGTIFSIYKRLSPVGTPPQKYDFLQKGSNQIFAGYVLYGSSTMLILTTGYGVNGFTLDPSLGTFFLSHPNLKFPEKGNLYSVNLGNYRAFDKGVKRYLEYCTEETDGRPYSLRYIGSLVSDFHRNILKGGIYMYPSTRKDTHGKIRLLYEANPMALIAESAGGKASDGRNRILDIQPTELHQRTPIFVGVSSMVDKLEEFVRES